MNNLENIKMTMDAIKSVKEQAKKAAQLGDFVKYKELMSNLLALENCLVTEVDKGLKVA